jgi:Holliday junction resolvasome RuvABC endonuclease subunit
MLRAPGNVGYSRCHHDRHPQTPRAEGSAMIVLGIDPGQRTLGYCVARFIGSKREHHVSGSVKEVETDLVSWLSGMLDAHQIDVLGIEDHVWMGAEKSANPQAFSISKLVGSLAGGALMWSRLRGVGLGVFLIPKQRCNAAVGITGKAPKARVKAAVQALFPAVPFKNEHEADAVAVCVAARARSLR